MVDLTDQEIIDAAMPKLLEYQRRLGLDDWNLELEVIGDTDLQRCRAMDGDTTCPAGKTFFDLHHREALIMLNRDVVASYSGVAIPYILAHEMGHLMSSQFSVVVEHAASLVPSKMHPALHNIIDEEWKWTDEHFAHMIARTLGAKQPPADFWVMKQAGYQRNLYHD